MLRLSLASLACVFAFSLAPVQAHEAGSQMAQVANVEDLLAQGIDVLILHPVNTVAAGSLVEKARRENVPVVSMDIKKLRVELVED